MSDQPPSPFAPFLPSPPITPEKPKAETTKPENAKQKAAREKREAKDAKALAQAAAQTQISARRTAELMTGTTRSTRKPRGPNKSKGGIKAHSPKFDLQTTLAAAQLLNEGDFPLFEKLVVVLDEAGKPARDRVLGALSKVFG